MASSPPKTKTQRFTSAVSAIGGVAGIIALILVLLLQFNMPAQTFTLLRGNPGQTGATGQTGPPGPSGPAGTNGTDAYNVTYKTVIYMNNNQTFNVLCTILKSQLNSSKNQTLSCTVVP